MTTSLRVDACHDDLGLALTSDERQPGPDDSSDSAALEASTSHNTLGKAEAPPRVAQLLRTW